jgi:transposase
MSVAPEDFSSCQRQNPNLAAALQRIPPARASCSMPLLTPEFKQHVLQHYQEGVEGSGFNALAARFGMPGKGSTIRSWHSRWDGSIESLQRKPGGGRPRILSEQQVQRHIVQHIRRSNRLHKAVHYAPLRAQLIAATHKQPSLRTVQRYGHDVQVTQRRTKKRTAKERQLTLPAQPALASVCSAVAHFCCSAVQWVLIIVRRSHRHVANCSDWDCSTFSSWMKHICA